MSLTQDLENYVTSKGYVSSDELEQLQFEIGERVKNGSTQWDDLYTTLLQDKVIEMEDSLEQFNLTRDQRVLDEWEDERLNDVED